MAINTYKILSINPGTRYMALAIFNNSELREWEIKSVHGKNKTLKITDIISIISNIISRFGINILVIKKLNPSHSTNTLNACVSKINEIGKQIQLNTVEYSVQETERILLPQTKRNKRMLMDEICLRYPFLHKECEKEKRLKNNYFIRMFEAIAQGIACYTQLECGELKFCKNNKK